MRVEAVENTRSGYTGQITISSLLIIMFILTMPVVFAGASDLYATIKHMPKDGYAFFKKIRCDVNVALTPDADYQAKAFLEFLITTQAQKIIATEGWVR